jgi:zinc/manganese transport system permease protein
VLADSGFTWDLIEDVRRLLEFHFMVNAYRAGTIVAVVAGVVGWFMVLRRQTFAGHTLSVVAFPGAAGATLVGISALYGYFGFCLAAALAIAAVPRAGRHATSEESAVIGTVQAFALACGFLFVTLYGGLLDSVNSLLFGSFLGVTDGQVATLLAVGVAALAVVASIGRPLLFASLDPDVAAAHGVPVRLLSVVFLVVLGVAVAEASQITGALLVFALLVVPAATAQVVTARPVLGLVLSVVIGVGVTWLALACSYFSDQPIGFFVTTLAFAAYLTAHAGRWVVGRWVAGRDGPARPIPTRIAA